eukprot:XP_014037485.1 PREDICTED: von Willebrand factor A domain-containing protein 7-like [Salmo salar]
MFNGDYHFDGETFVEGRKLITDGVSSVKASIKRGNFEAARQKLGDILHTLQDFYSHSNWIELGNRFPNSNLIRSDVSDIGPVADRLMMSSVLAVVSLLLLQTGVQGFLVLLSGSSMDHLEITREAILQTTAKVCKQLASVEGRDFTLPPGPLTAESLALACSSSGSAKSFLSAISDVTWRNAGVDFRHTFDEEYHFDGETFVEGRKLITDGVSSVKASIKQENFEEARQKLGDILHTLQDFYSHSNWIELGNRFPHSNLIRSDLSDIGPVADKNTPTCRSCVGKDCQNNILEDIIRDKKLTSGYFSLEPFFSIKPKGKCSHGGLSDQTSRQEPTGGINKDSLESSHGNWHTAAAEVAVAATSQLLEDIRGAAGDTDFLRWGIVLDHISTVVKGHGIRLKGP